MSENQAQYAATGASRSHEAEIIRERIKATLEHTIPALAAFLAHGEPTPGSGGSLCELADDAAALAELMAMFPPDAPKQPTPETTAHVSWLVQRLLTTSRACRSWWPALPWTRLKGSLHHGGSVQQRSPCPARAEHILAKQHDPSTATRRRRRLLASSLRKSAASRFTSTRTVMARRASSQKARISWF